MEEDEKRRSIWPPMKRYFKTMGQDFVVWMAMLGAFYLVGYLLFEVLRIQSH